MARRRHLSRIAVMQTLFERASRGKESKPTLKRNIEELSDEGLPDVEFAESLLQGVERMEEDIKSAVQDHAPGWTLDRMDPIARSVLFIGAYELLYANDAPPAVVMNECIEIAKEFGTDESGKFVNGVLNAIAKDLGMKKGDN